MFNKFIGCPSFCFICKYFWTIGKRKPATQNKINKQQNINFIVWHFPLQPSAEQFFFFFLFAFHFSTTFLHFADVISNVLSVTYIYIYLRFFFCCCPFVCNCTNNLLFYYNLVVTNMNVTNVHGFALYEREISLQIEN